jgi:nicotinate-nucleotide pyrophosphorylase (carboxylating)
MKEFQQTVWDDRLRADWESILRLAICEDFGEEGDWTTNSLVDADAFGSAAVVARKSGVVAGLTAVEMTLQAVDPRLAWLPKMEDGQSTAPGSCAGIIRGPVRGMLSAERVVLNLICRLSGVATLTRKYVETIAGTKAKIYDTRKTTPGWRRLEKYAVRCGGGWNHRSGLYEAVLIKDNHLAWGASGSGKVSEERQRYTPAEAVRIAREYAKKHGNQSLPSSLPSPLSPLPSPQSPLPSILIEVEVDTLEQLEEVLPAGPEIVLLDNMSPEQMRKAVEIRNRKNRNVELEASGGIDLQTVRAAAESGVERISVGALTHSAVALDFGLDWLE